MRKLFLLLFTTLFLTSINAQEQNWIMQTRLLNVDAEDVQKFESAVAKKTKMYNSKEGTARWLTFRILTGPNANNYVRAQLETSWEMFDNVDTVGNAYWQKTVGPLHTAEGGQFWWRNNGVSYNPGTNDGPKKLRRIIFYNYKDSKRQDFWRFRQRVAKAMEASSFPGRMSVFYCASGCNGNWVQVRFHHDSFTAQAETNGEPLENYIAKYNEMYGNDSYEQDGDKMQESLMPDGMRVRHLEYLPELSSPWGSRGN